jgi:hypothetical protein
VIHAPHEIIARRLGWAGLLPFCAAPVAILCQPAWAAQAGSLLADYAFAIACFLTGIWWGLALIRRDSAALLFSNGLFLALFACRALLPESGFLIAVAVLLLAILAVERSHPLFRRQPSYYRKLRARLTAVACGSTLMTSVLMTYIG